jgi:phosphotriesterase-related protein
MPVACRHDNRIIMTVNGPVEPAQMGVSLIHEHVMVDFIGADSTGPHRWQRDTVLDKVLPYLEEVHRMGCATFIDCTPAFLGRDVMLLKTLSDSSGLNIITNTGYYGAVKDKFIPRQAFAETAEELARHWIDEWENGIEGTGIRPGIIKIGVERNDTLSEMHRKLVRAAAITHLATGLTIVSHTGPEKPVFQQISVLKEEGVSPEALVWTHAQEGTRQAQVKAAGEGVWVSLDHVNNDPEAIAEYIGMIRNMRDNKLLHKVLLSHDAGWYDVQDLIGNRFRPYTAIFSSLLPALQQEGFTEEEINLLMVENPKNAYTVRRRKI